MKIENEPQEKHLVLYVYVVIIDEFNSKWMNKEKHNHQQEKQISKLKIQYTLNFQNVLW